MGVLALLLLCVVLELEERVHLLLVLEVCLFIIGVRRPIDRAPILVGDLELADALQLLLVDLLELVILLLICSDGHE